MLPNINIELPYKILIDNLISEKISIDGFVTDFMNQWRIDKDNITYFDTHFQRIINYIYSICGNYLDGFETTQSSLINEIKLLRYIGWGFN